VKKRQGFVSNSSSSSFIVGAGKIKNLDEFNKWAKKNAIDAQSGIYTDVSIHTTTELLSCGNWSFGIGGESEKSILWVEEPTNYGGKINAKFDPAGDDHYCVVYISNDEGDYPFWNGEDYEYDIDSDYFEGKQAAILEMLASEDLLENSIHSYGAGRNG